MKMRRADKDADLTKENYSSSNYEDTNRGRSVSNVNMELDCKGPENLKCKNFNFYNFWSNWAAAKAPGDEPNCHQP